MIPIFWGLAYPSLGGDIVFKDVSLSKPAIVSAKKAKINPKISTMFNRNFVVESAEFFDFEAVINLKDPTEIIRCVSGNGCQANSITPRPSKAKDKVEDESKGKKREPKKLIVEHFVANNGTLLLRGESEYQFKLSSLSGDNFQLPLKDSNFDVYAIILFENELETQKIKAKLSWDGTQERLQVKAILKDFPLELAERVLNELKPIETRSQSTTTGNVSGVLNLNYNAKTKTWENVPSAFSLLF
jgi:hypothetical protein